VFILARYSLIIRDSTYAKLVQECARTGQRMGKLLNEIIYAYVAKLCEGGGVPATPVCIVCGRSAVFQYFGFGQQKLYVCAFHRDVGRGMRGLKRLGEAAR